MKSEVPAPPPRGEAAGTPPEAGRPQGASGHLAGSSESTDYARGSLRDVFLDALDSNDPERTAEIARHLVTCGNPLPSATCNLLGLPAGSSYGAGARAVLAKTARER